MKLKYSNYMDTMFLGEVIYFWQILITVFSNPTVIFLGIKERLLLKLLIKFAEIKTNSFFCDSWEIGHNLVFFNKPIYSKFSLKWLKKIRVTQKNYEQLMWSIVLTKNG